MSDIENMIAIWRTYVNTIDQWQDLVDGVEPKATACGPVYELPNPLGRLNESFAIADMRNIDYSEPHYHTNNETEIQIVISGSGLWVVGGQEHQLTKGSVVVMLPEVAYFTIAGGDLVIAAINTPPFDPNNYETISESNSKHRFDKDQYERLIR